MGERKNMTNTDDRPALDEPIGFITLLKGLVLPLVLFALAATWLVVADPLRFFDNSAPPVERLTVEQTILDDKGIHLKVRAGGNEPMTIAQIQVDGAYWQFTQEPKGKLDRLQAAWLHLPYPWVNEEVHAIVLITNTGVTFEHEIAVAVATVGIAAMGIGTLLMIGTFVGIIPVAVGMMFFPILRRLSSSGTRFILALTLGLLTFLLVDMGFESLELAAESAPSLQANAMVVLVTVFVALGLIAIGRAKGPPGALALAFYLALGIGLHNFGEGLAIGSALATGAVGLGAFLILGFSVHNITEGIGIAAPLVKKPPALIVFAALVLIAGAPAILGVWLGTYALAPHWAAFAIAIGMGAIIQVLFEVGSFMTRQSAGLSKALDQYALGGFAVGLVFMYVSAVAIKI